MGKRVHTVQHCERTKLELQGKGSALGRVSLSAMEAAPSLGLHCLSSCGDATPGSWLLWRQGSQVLLLAWLSVQE